MQKRVAFYLFIVSVAALALMYAVSYTSLKEHMYQTLIKRMYDYIADLRLLSGEVQEYTLYFERKAYPVMEQILSHKVMGIVKMFQSLQKLVAEGKLTEEDAKRLAKEYLKGYKMGRGYVYLLDMEGTTIFHPDKSLIGVNIERFRFGKRIKGMKDGALVYFLRGKLKVAAWKTFPPWGWKVGLCIYAEDIPRIIPPLFKEKLIENLKEYITNTNTNSYGFYTAIYGPNGELIAYPNRELSRDDAPFLKIIRRVVKEEEGMFSYRFDGEEKIKVFTTFHPFDWHIVLTATPDRQITPIIATILMKEFLPIGITLILTVITAIMLLNRSVIHPLITLREGLRKIASGNLGYQVKLEGCKEIQKTMAQFNSASLKLKQYEDDLHTSYEELVALNEELQQEEAEMQEESERLKHIAEIARRTSQLLKKEEIAKETVNVIKDLYGFKNINICIIEEGIIKPLALSGIFVEGLVEVPVDIGIRGWAITTKEPKNVPDVSKEPRYLMGDPSIKSELACPIIYKGKVVGIIDIESPVQERFGKREEEFIKMVANYLAVAFNTCDTMENLWREAEELNILLEIIREGSKAKTLQELARIITTTIGRARDYENLSLFTKEGDKLVLQYSYYKEGHKPSPDTPLYGYTIGINQKSVIVRATKQGEMQNIPDTSKEPEYLCGYECFSSELAVPIKAGDEVIAVLNTESKKLNAFDTQEELFLSLAAEESAGMIQNITLQEELKAKNEELMRTLQELTEKESKLSSTIEQIESYTKEIEETNRKLSQKEEQLKRAYMQTIKALSELIEIKDPYTRGHSLRVAKWSVRIAKEMGISEPPLQRIFLAGLLHDIGKIGIKGAVLNKAGKLTEEEYDEIKKHPVIGANILREVKHLQDIVPVVLHHHERWDGRGYPDGLKGTEIPLWSRIMAVADTLDAMTSSRPYRKALSIEDAVEEIKRNAGRQFDPDVVEAFLKIIIEGKDIPK